jgi:hypothetical protein
MFTELESKFVDIEAVNIDTQRRLGLCVPPGGRVRDVLEMAAARLGMTDAAGKPVKSLHKASPISGLHVRNSGARCRRSYCRTQAGHRGLETGSQRDGVEQPGNCGR